jgi:hypothetical protein
MRGKRLAVKILVWLTFVLCAGGILFCVGYRLRHPVNGNPNPQSQKQERDRVNITQQDNSSPSGKQADNQENYAGKWLEPITILTVFLVMGVAITAYIYWRQLKEMHKTVTVVEGQGKTMKEQLTAMQSSLNQNERSVKIAEQNTRIATEGARPFLEINAQLMFHPHLPIHIIVGFFNNGNSEAVVDVDYEIIIKGSIKAEKRGSVARFTLAPRQRDEKQIIGINAAEVEAVGQKTASIVFKLTGEYSGLGRLFPVNFCRTCLEHRPQLTTETALNLNQECDTNQSNPN